MVKLTVRRAAGKVVMEKEAGRLEADGDELWSGRLPLCCVEAGLLHPSRCPRILSWAVAVECRDHVAGCIPISFLYKTHGHLYVSL